MAGTIQRGFYRDTMKGERVEVIGLARDAVTNSVVVVVDTTAGLMIFKPWEFEEKSRFTTREGGFREGLRFEAEKEAVQQENRPAP